MRLWLIQWEEFGGDEHTRLVAAPKMNECIAVEYALAAMRKREKHADQSDLCYVTHRSVGVVKDLAGNKYTIELIKS